MPEVRLHPNTDVLLEFAAGSLSPAQAVAVSAHLFYCPPLSGKNQVPWMLSAATYSPIAKPSACLWIAEAM